MLVGSSLAWVPSFGRGTGGATCSDPARMSQTGREWRRPESSLRATVPSTAMSSPGSCR